MNDTSAEIAQMVHDRYVNMSPLERFMIGVGMFESARAMVMASLPDNLSPEERRTRLCRRLHPDLDEAAYAAIAQTGSFAQW